MALAHIKELLKKYNSLPKKNLGQNFLFDQNAIAKIIAAAGLEKSDIVVEIGPGTGILTQELAKTAKQVIAVEKDCLMVKILNDEFFGSLNVKIIQADILKFDTGVLPPDYKIAANLPFYNSAAIIRKFLEIGNPPQAMALIIQKEVAQRIVANPPDSSLLAISTQFYANAKICGYIKRSSFWPPPNVDAAIIKIVPRKVNYGKDFVKTFFKILHSGFAHPRKQLAGNLSKGLGIDREEAIILLAKNNIRPEQRAETLALEQWKSLSYSFAQKNNL